MMALRGGAPCYASGKVRVEADDETNCRENLATLASAWQLRFASEQRFVHERSHQSNMSMNSDSSEIIVGLDLGTTKVSAVVGEVDEDGITILGVGNVPCRGLRKGVVSNIEWTVRSIREAVEAAQNMAGVEIQSVYAGVAGGHIRSQMSDGVCAISGREVTAEDLERVLEGARAIPNRFGSSHSARSSQGVRRR